MNRNWSGKKQWENVPDIGNSPCEEGKTTHPKLSRSSKMNPSSLAARAHRPEAGTAPLPKPWEAARCSARPRPTAVSGHKATSDRTASAQLNTGPEVRPGARWGKGGGTHRRSAERGSIGRWSTLDPGQAQMKPLERL